MTKIFYSLENRTFDVYYLQTAATVEKRKFLVWMVTKIAICNHACNCWDLTASEEIRNEGYRKNIESSRSKLGPCILQKSQTPNPKPIIFGPCANQTNHVKRSKKIARGIRL